MECIVPNRQDSIIVHVGNPSNDGLNPLVSFKFKTANLTDSRKKSLDGERPFTRPLRTQDNTKTQKRRISMLRLGIELTIPAFEQPMVCDIVRRRL
jgi:hypothetical protein